ncbi:MAG: hypothetical protein M3461_07365 [Pseudomonadota bacterium]|nr:hypothetical protein [Pseudomonadota bacterium]
MVIQNRDLATLPGGNTGATALTNEPAAAKGPPPPKRRKYFQGLNSV